MAIQVRKGNEADFDVNKMLPAEFAVCTDTGKVFVCTSAGNTKELASVEELQGILGASDEAYQAFQELMEQMDNDTVVTGLLADVSNLKTGNYTISFFEPEERGNIEPSDTVKTIFGKIRKVIADLAAVSFSGKYSSLVFTDIESVTAPSDENTMILDSSGTPQKITWANVFSTISDGIKAKILEWTFTNLGTTNKTIIGAVNELNMNIDYISFRALSGDYWISEFYTDANNIDRSVFGRIISGTITNVPYPEDWGIILALVNKKVNTQIQFCLEESHGLYIRIKTQNNWTEWKLAGKSV